MTFDRRLVYELVANHLTGDGLRPRMEGDGVHLGLGEARFRIRTDAAKPPVEGEPAVLVWVDIAGLDDRVMSVDVSGWGTSDEDRAIDLTHGITDCILPPVLWLLDGEGISIDPRAVVAMTAASGAEWEVVVGRPWVVAASEDGADAANAIADEIRAGFEGEPSGMAQHLDPIIRPLLDQPITHWIKVYLGVVGPSQFDGRIDVDNERSWPGAEWAASFTWPSHTAVQLVRQLIVLKPVGLVPGSAPSGTGRGLLARMRGAFRG